MKKKTNKRSVVIYIETEILRTKAGWNRVCLEPGTFSFNICKHDGANSDAVGISAFHHGTIQKKGREWIMGFDMDLDDHPVKRRRKRPEKLRADSPRGGDTQKDRFRPASQPSKVMVKGYLGIKACGTGMSSNHMKN